MIPISGEDRDGGSGTRKDTPDLDDFCVDEETSEPFDPHYMRKLYDLGLKLAAGSDFWEAYPPYSAAQEDKQ